MEHWQDIQAPGTIQQDGFMGNAGSFWMPDYTGSEWVLETVQSHQMSPFFYNHADGVYYPPALHHMYEPSPESWIINPQTGQFTHLAGYDFPQASGPLYVQSYHPDAHLEAHHHFLHDVTAANSSAPQILHPGEVNYDNISALEPYATQIPQQTCTFQDVHHVPDWSDQTHHHHPQMWHQPGSLNPPEAAPEMGVGVFQVPLFPQTLLNISEPQDDWFGTPGYHRNTHLPL